jgi:thiol-disulfide isomerase/thioredoxin
MVHPAGGTVLDLKSYFSNRRATRGLLWIAVLLAFVLLVYNARTNVRIVPGDEGVPATGLPLMDIRGSRVSLADFEGQVVLVNIWASWCGYCRMEIPELEELHHKYQEQGLVVLGVNWDEATTRELEDMIQDLEISYPVLLPAGRFEGPFLTSGTIPQTWIVDRAGRVRVSHTGYASGDSLDKVVRQLLQEG